ncbi:cysteine hydrolase family protein [Arthrobacter sp. H14]|uniref:cysteine hydrolase family protein n=1 Tax=Arthrobacter sp. H14 TaxID=1312959 RepID=UPI0004791ADC|nr:isochorismatase family cysteine hydrolase [Arthrobacter sp. H14]
MSLDRSALVTIDVQRDFYETNAPARIDGTAECIPAMSRVARAFRLAGRPIIHVVRLYVADGSNAEPVRRTVLSTASIVRPGTKGSQVATDLLPPEAPQLDADVLLDGALQQAGRSEWLMYKPRWGAFYNTPLEEHLRRLEVTDLAFVGCNFPNCPRTSLYEASERDFATVLVSDAVSGTYERGLREVADIGVTVTTSEAIITALRATANELAPKG